MQPVTTQQLFDQTEQLSHEKNDQLQTDDLLDLVSNQSSSLCPLEKFIAYSEDSYTRFSVSKKAYSQWLCYGWRKSQMSPIHGHERSLGLIFVSHGVLRNETFSLEGSQLKLLDCSVLTEGSILVLPRYAIHRVIGISSLAASIHLYTPLLPLELPIY